MGLGIPAFLFFFLLLLPPLCPPPLWPPSTFALIPFGICSFGKKKICFLTVGFFVYGCIWTSFFLSFSLLIIIFEMTSLLHCAIFFYLFFYVHNWRRIWCLSWFLSVECKTLKYCLLVSKVTSFVTCSGHFLRHGVLMDILTAMCNGFLLFQNTDTAHIPMSSHSDLSHNLKRRTRAGTMT